MILQCEPLIGQTEQGALNRYMKSGGFLTEYNQTKEFEKMLADYLGVKYVSMTTSGTAALFLAITATASQRNFDRVLIPDYTMIATANAVRMAWLYADLIDVDKKSFCMSADRLEEHLKKDRYGVGAVIYVDINGRAGEIDRVKRICKKNNLTLIEDACQAFGSEHNGKKLGTFGRFGCFSLSFHKIITTGEGGFVVSHNKKDYEMIERLKNFGRLEGGADIHKYLGFNFLYTDLQAVVGMEQLKTIDWRIKKKRQVFEWYYGYKPDKGYVPWFYEWFTVVEKGDFKIRSMYPPIHTQPIYDGKEKDFPVASSIDGVWLPSSLTLTKKQVNYIKEHL